MAFTFGKVIGGLSLFCIAAAAEPRNSSAGGGVSVQHDGRLILWDLYSAIRGTGLDEPAAKEGDLEDDYADFPLDLVTTDTRQKYGLVPDPSVARAVNALDKMTDIPTSLRYFLRFHVQYGQLTNIVHPALKLDPTGVYLPTASNLRGQHLVAVSRFVPSLGFLIHRSSWNRMGELSRAALRIHHSLDYLRALVGDRVLNVKSIQELVAAICLSRQDLLPREFLDSYQNLVTQRVQEGEKQHAVDRGEALLAKYFGFRPEQTLGQIRDWELKQHRKRDSRTQEFIDSEWGFLVPQPQTTFNVSKNDSKVSSEYDAYHALEVIQGYQSALERYLRLASLRKRLKEANASLELQKQVVNELENLVNNSRGYSKPVLLAQSGLYFNFAGVLYEAGSRAELPRLASFLDGKPPENADIAHLGLCERLRRPNGTDASPIVLTPDGVTAVISACTFFPLVNPTEVKNPSRIVPWLHKAVVESTIERSDTSSLMKHGIDPNHIEKAIDQVLSAMKNADENYVRLVKERTNGERDRIELSASSLREVRRLNNFWRLYLEQHELIREE